MDDKTKTNIQVMVLSCDGIKSAVWETGTSSILKLEIDVHIPQDCEAKGISDSGVRAIEPVRLEFTKQYPFRAPRIVLREDFPRSFPHINPTTKDVIPCIYEGDLTELIQQAGIEAVINQLTAWLRKAAANDLMDFAQGWEPMRNDDWKGIIKGDFRGLQSEISTKALSIKISANKIRGLYNLDFDAVISFTPYESAKYDRNSFPCFIYAASPNTIISSYYPNQITNLGELRLFLINNLDHNCAKAAMDDLSSETTVGKCVVIAAIRRPVHLINSDSNIEFLSFLIDIQRTKKRRHIVLKSAVTLLRTEDLCSPALLRCVSGRRIVFCGKYVQIGCGSLGSKISLHLLRNGLDNLCFIDNDILLPHNMGRHALIWEKWGIPKHKAMEVAASRFNAKYSSGDDLEKIVPQLSSADLIVDSSASLAVRNRLSLADIKAKVVHSALYGRGDAQCGVCFIEGTDRNPRIDDICFRFMRANVLDNLGAVDYSAQYLERHTYGQGCSGLTMKVDDSTISLLAAGMGHHLQKYLDAQFPETGDCSFGVTKDGESLQWHQLQMGKTIIIPGIRPDGYQVRVLAQAKEEMDHIAKSAKANETGGYLVGAVTMSTRTITVVSCLAPTVDSCGTRYVFVLGNKGMKIKKDDLEKKSNGVLGLLGTWHSHPFGGAPSVCDRETYEKLFSNRAFPTLCLIWTPDGVECLPEMTQ